MTVNYANIFDANVDSISSNSIASSSTSLQTKQGAVPATVRSATAEAPLSAAAIENRFGSVFQGLGQMPGKLHLDIDESETPVVMPPPESPSLSKPSSRLSRKGKKILVSFRKLQVPKIGYQILSLQKSQTRN